MTQSRTLPSYSVFLLLLHLLPILCPPVTHAAPLPTSHPLHPRSPERPSFLLNTTVSRAQTTTAPLVKSAPAQNKPPPSADAPSSRNATSSATTQLQHNISNSTSRQPDKPDPNSSNATSSIPAHSPSPPLPSDLDENHADMSPTDMLAHARQGDGRLLQGGIVEFIEWLFVFILVAPGTFPAIGCVLLTCASFWRRRFAGHAPADQESSRDDVHPDFRAIAAMVPGGYQRVSLVDHGALVSRTRKNVTEDREADP